MDGHHLLLMLRTILPQADREEFGDRTECALKSLQSLNAQGYGLPEDAPLFIEYDELATKLLSSPLELPQPRGEARPGDRILRSQC